MKDIIVITGATGGMGAHLAKNISNKDIILLAGRNKEKLDDLKKELLAKKIKAETIICDMKKSSDIKKLANKTKDLGHFKIMVHTAGISEHMGTTEDILNTNLIGTKLLMDEFYKIADDSIFINIASMSGHVIDLENKTNDILLNPLDEDFFNKINPYLKKDGGKAYSLSKKGVILLSEAEAKKWSTKNSRIISVSPGAIKTALALKEEEHHPEMTHMINNSPIPRYGDVKEVTDLVKFLISDKAKFITGADFLIDGGATSYLKSFMNKKEDIFPTIITAFILYLFSFMFFPLIFQYFYTDNYLQVIQDSLVFFVNPGIVILITMYLSKEKLNIYLILMPFIIGIISNIFIYNSFNIINSMFYSIIALLISFLVKCYIKEDKLKQKK